jgi:hypothetical protein
MANGVDHLGVGGSQPCVVLEKANEFLSSEVSEAFHFLNIVFDGKSRHETKSPN